MKSKLSLRKFKLGDIVKEKDDARVGLVVHVIAADPTLVLISWPPDRQGYVYHVDDLALVTP